MAERLSLDDDSLYQGYADHIQRYAFAAQYCSGRRVLDAGCGTGYETTSEFLSHKGGQVAIGLW